MTAQTRRARLANAHAAYTAALLTAGARAGLGLQESADEQMDEADIAFEAALLETQTIDEEDVILEIGREGTTITVTLESGDGLEIDAYGNVLRGALE